MTNDQMSLTRREWDAVVLLGCLAGTGIVCMFWIVTLVLAELNRAIPGAGWLGAVVLTLGGGLILRHELRFLNKPSKTESERERSEPCE